MQLCSTYAYAVRAFDQPVQFVQPDGVTVTVKIHGDDLFHYMTTLSGAPVMMDKDGYLCYAEFDGQGRMVPGTRRLNGSDDRQRSGILSSGMPFSYVARMRAEALMRRQQSEEQAGVVLGASLSGSRSSDVQKSISVGSKKILIILAAFADRAFATPSPNSAFYNMFNQSGYSANGAKGSVRDYYRLNSSKIFDPEFTVVGPVTLPGDMAYYGANNDSGNDVNPRKMISDACERAARLVDFSQFDNDGDGFVDGIFVIYAGYSESEHGGANTIWPHKSYLTVPMSFGGVKVYLYACSSELRGYSGANMSGMGTFCHEYGHVLGLPDMYDTDGDANGVGYGLGHWSIMDYGSYLNGGIRI